MQASWQRIGGVEAEMKAAGAWVFSARLHEPTTATVVRVSNGEVLTTDGPFVETKDHLGGFYVIEAADSASLDLVASRISAQIPVPAEEVRSLLSGNAAGILGPRRLLWPWRDGIQWNPADDRCSAVRIRRESRDATDRDGGVRIRGSLVEIAPASP